MTMTIPTRPTMSGPGSSATAWRAYAAAISGTNGWDELSRDEIITLLQEGGFLDADGNPTDQASVPTPEADPKASQLKASEPEITDGSTATPASPSRRVTSESSEESEPKRGLVTEPCKQCYPGGWPSKQKGSSASCHHGLTITQGQEVEITRQQAIEMGFIDGPGKG